MSEEKIELDIKDTDLLEEDFLQEELDSDETNWKLKAQELKGIAKRRATQLKKAKEAVEVYQNQITELKTPKESLTKQNKKDEKKGLDYSQKAYLTARGIEQEFFSEVEKAAESFGGVEIDGVLERVLSNPYFISELEIARENKSARENSPKGGARGGSGGVDSVEFWLKKGGLPPLDGTEERIRFRGQIIEARKNQSKKEID